MECQHLKKLCLALLVQTAALAAAAPAMAVTYNLRADRTTITLPGPDGVPVTVPVWGFADDGNTPGSGTVTVPGPKLSVTAGDTLTINLVNRLPVPVSLVIPGQRIVPNANPPGAANYDASVPAANISQNPNFPVPVQPIAPTQRVRSFTTEAAPNGGSAVYNFGVAKTGTFLYESGTNPALQIPMGLHGALVVGPGASGAAYTPTATNSATSYDRDQVLLFGEILARYDFTLNRFFTMNEDVDRNSCVTAATDTGSCSQWKTPLPYPLTITTDNSIKSTLDYQPLYYLINGKSYPDTVAAQPISTAPGAPTVPGIYAPYGTAGRTLLRMINAGGQSRVPTIQGSYRDNSSTDPALALPRAIYPQPIAEDGNLYPYPKQEFAPILPAGKTMDVMLNLTGAGHPGYYTLYDRTLGVTNAGHFPGGMLSFLASWDPNTRNCSPFKGDLNGDGIITISDAVLALRKVVGNQYDANGDVSPVVNGLPCGSSTGPTTGTKTALDITDSLFILQKAVGTAPQPY
ncbi:MAG TPA: hypothetical protein VJ550_00995 [Geomonas sp.]|nr:hypothetical protein [Geomonas sp.]